MKLIIAEKPAVAFSIAKALNIKGSKDGYIENKDFVISWCVGHLVALAEPSVYDEKYATVEFRIFRGTLRYETFIATLEFTHYLCETAMRSNDEQFQAMSWTDFVRGIKENDYSELIEYLKRRRLYISEQTATEG